MESLLFFPSEWLANKNEVYGFNSKKKKNCSFIVSGFENDILEIIHIAFLFMESYFQKPLDKIVKNIDAMDEILMKSDKMGNFHKTARLQHSTYGFT